MGGREKEVGRVTMQVATGTREGSLEWGSI